MRSDGMWSGGGGWWRGNRRRRGVRTSMLNVSARASEQRAERMHRAGAIFLVLAVLGMAGWLATVGTQRAVRMLFSENSLFTIRRLDVSSDGRLTPDLLRQYAKVAQGDNLFAVDVRRVRDDLAAVPLVKAVQVNRTLPDALSVRVVERTPLARIVMPGVGLQLAVDREGWVLGPGSASAVLPILTGFATPGLRPGIRLTGDEIRDALELLDLCDRTRLFQYVPIREVHREDSESLLLRLARGEEVLLPREKLERRVKDLSGIVREMQASRRPSGAGVHIDMSAEISYSATGLLE